MADVPITVALVVKNEIDFIEQAIDSLLTTSPSFLELKILIVDDGSSDGTYEYCSDLGSQMPNVEVVRNSGTGKVAGTLTGLSLVSSGWMKFVDGDDYVDFSSLVRNDFWCDAFYHDFYSVCDEGGTKICRTSKAYAANSASFVSKLRTLPKGMFFFKRELFDRIEESSLLRLMFEDVFINFYIGVRAKKIKKVSKPLYYYRQHAANYYGGGFRGRPKKLAIMAERLSTSKNILTEIHEDLQFHPAIDNYVKVLMSLRNWRSLIKLLRYPDFFLKAVYYHVISTV